MKKYLIALLFLLVSGPAIAQVIEGGVCFDWITKTQMQRDENITQIQKILFTETTIVKYPKKKFKEQYSAFLKDENYKKNYIEISNGKKEDEKANYCSFYYKNTPMLLAYGVQYKNDLNHVYYYDALGSFRYVDVFSSNYPKFPYFSYQYNWNGELIATYYYVSDYDQYIFGPKKEFKGRWYKENLYNRKAKIIMTRSNY